MLWKKVPGYPKYLVSDTGLVSATWHRGTEFGKEMILKQKIDRYGYPCVRLYNNGRIKDTYVHALVAKAFVSGQAPELQVNHIDGIKTNNGANNLEWVTPSENVRHAVRLGLTRSCVGELNTQSRMTASQVVDIYRMVLSGEKRHVVAAKFGISRSHVSGIAAGNKWAHVTGIKK